MTFGFLKSAIEHSLIDSYKNEKEFKKTLREFRENVLSNKSISKVYALYEQLSTPQGLSQNDAEHFLSEGLNLINRTLPNIKLPKSHKQLKENIYQDIDTLVYDTKYNLKERVESKKRILNTLTTEPQKINETINIPISSMVKIANLTLENYIEKMDSNSRKIFLEIIKEDKKELEEQYFTLKENTLKKLTEILSEQSEDELKTKISETIKKLEMEEFTKINYVKLKSLENGL